MLVAEFGNYSWKTTWSPRTVDLLSYSVSLQQADKSDEVFCQYSILSCGKVPGKREREEEEEKSRME